LQDGSQLAAQATDETAECGQDEDDMEEEEEEGEDEDTASDDEDTDAEEDAFKKQALGKRNEDKEAKKERKLKSKEGAREKWRNKIPKADKKRRIKATSKKR
jgi:RIO kinase 1